MKKALFPAVLAAVMLLTACGASLPAQTTEEDKTDTAPAPVTQAEHTGGTTEEPGTEAETSGAAGTGGTEKTPEKTAAPVIKGTVTVGAGEAIVYGTCEPNSRLKVSAGDSAFEAYADGGYFAVPVTCKRSVTVTVTATSDKGSESDGASVLVKYRKNAEDRGVTATLGSRVIEKKVLPDQYGTNAFDGSELAALKKSAAYRVKKAADKAGKSVRIVYVIAPDPLTVYPEELTAEMTENIEKKNARLEQTVKALSEVEGVTVIDLRAAMAENRENGKLYYKLDSHWTELGAYYGYAETVSALGMTARPLSDFRVEYIDIDDTDMNVYSGVGTGEMYESAPFLTPLFEADTPYFAKKEKSARFWNYANEFFVGKTSVSLQKDQTGVALVLLDSYGFNIVPYLSLHFGTFVTQRVWSHNCDYGLVSEYSPDVIIHIIAERDLGELVSAT